jgi:hypothetical protein
MTAQGQRNRTARTRWILAAFGCLALAVLAVTLTVYNPETTRHYPRCLSYRLFGLQCASCGVLRAAHALLHGDVSRAFHCNPLFTVAAPMALAWVVVKLLRTLAGRRTAPTALGRWIIPVIVALLVMYTALRNIPWAPLTWLRAPDSLDQAAMPQ